MNLVSTTMIKNGETEFSYVVAVSKTPLSFETFTDIIRDDIMTSCSDAKLAEYIINALDTEAPFFSFDKKNTIAQFHIAENSWLDWRVIEIPDNIYEMIVRKKKEAEAIKKEVCFDDKE